MLSTDNPWISCYSYIRETTEGRKCSGIKILGLLLNNSLFCYELIFIFANLWLQINNITYIHGLYKQHITFIASFVHIVHPYVTWATIPIIKGNFLSEKPICILLLHTGSVSTYQTLVMLNILTGRTNKLCLFVSYKEVDTWLS